MFGHLGIRKQKQERPRFLAVFWVGSTPHAPPRICLDTQQKKDKTQRKGEGFIAFSLRVAVGGELQQQQKGVDFFLHYVGIGTKNFCLSQNFWHKIFLEEERRVAQLGNIKIDWEKGDGRATWIRRQDREYFKGKVTLEVSKFF